MDTPRSLDVALVGCGAITELFYAPALKALSKVEAIRVAAVVDPSPTRVGLLGEHFPAADRLATIEGLAKRSADLAIVASPPNFHAKQSVSLLHRGLHVLCEKPMASSVDEAQAMVDAALQVDRLLSVGLFRRFFPSSQLVFDLISSGVLGRPVSFQWVEGGQFNWPAASASFFQKSASSGGVFCDVGAHVLDLLLYWFGEPGKCDYEDDAMGGLEANARLRLGFDNGVTGTLHLSRDTALTNGTRIRFERGSVWFQGASADSVVMQFEKCSHVAKASLYTSPNAEGVGIGVGVPGLTYAQSFVEQIRNFCRAIRGVEPLRITGEQALRGMELMERCYASRRGMSLPWLTDAEREGIVRLNPKE